MVRRVVKTWELDHTATLPVGTRRSAWLARDTVVLLGNQVRSLPSCGHASAHYTASSRLEDSVNRNHLEIWPSFPVENRNLLAWGLPTKQACFLEAPRVQRDS